MPVLGDVADAAMRALAEALHALDAAGATHWVTYGTLLGLVREGRLLPHDNDVDLAILSGTADAAAVAVQMRRRGFALVLEERDADGVTKQKVALGPVLVELFYVRTGTPHWWDLSLAGRHSVVRNTHPPVAVVRRSLGGGLFPVPHHVEAYLEHLYGAEWRTPVTRWHWFLSPPNAELRVDWRDYLWLRKRQRRFRRANTGA